MNFLLIVFSTSDLGCHSSILPEFSYCNAPLSASWPACSSVSSRVRLRRRKNPRNPVHRHGQFISPSMMVRWKVVKMWMKSCAARRQRSMFLLWASIPSPVSDYRNIFICTKRIPGSKWAITVLVMPMTIIVHITIILMPCYRTS